LAERVITPEPGARALRSLEGARLLAKLAGLEDQRALQACLEGAPEYHLRTGGRPAEPDAARRLLEDAEADDLRRVFCLVPRTGGPAVGLLDVHLDHPEPGTAHVGLLLFRESCQGLGYGAEVVATLERALARGGFSALRCAVGDENPPARAFWERVGFAEVLRLEDGVAVLEKPVG
jgi:ribosomal protein S18 acetylase RimI-like enzyme